MPGVRKVCEQKGDVHTKGSRKSNVVNVNGVPTSGECRGRLRRLQEAAARQAVLQDDSAASRYMSVLHSLLPAFRFRFRFCSTCMCVC